MISKFFKRIFGKQNGTRAIIIHGHIFKNAGSTFDWALEKNFKKGFLDHRDDESMRKLGWKYLLRLLIDKPNIIALSSHHLTMPLPAHEEVKLLPAFLLRHPIERAKSVYLFEKKQPEKTAGSMHAKKLNFDAYVEWRMQTEVSPTIRDYQVRYLLGAKHKMQAIVSAGDYDIALKRLQESPLVGIVDRYDESMVVFEDFLRNFFPELDLSYIPQNVNQQHRDINLDKKAAEVISSLGSCGNLLTDNNAFDIRLFTSGNELLDERISSIEDFSAKLTSFRDRCNALK